MQVENFHQHQIQFHRLDHVNHLELTLGQMFSIPDHCYKIKKIIQKCWINRRNTWAIYGTFISHYYCIKSSGNENPTNYSNNPPMDPTKINEIEFSNNVNSIVKKSNKHSTNESNKITNIGGTLGWF